MDITLEDNVLEQILARIRRTTTSPVQATIFMQTVRFYSDMTDGVLILFLKSDELCIDQRHVWDHPGENCANGELRSWDLADPNCFDKATNYIREWARLTPAPPWIQ
jgi:hypothetical protein